MSKMTLEDKMLKCCYHSAAFRSFPIMDGENVEIKRGGKDNGKRNKFTKVIMKKWNGAKLYTQKKSLPVNTPDIFL